MLAYIQHAINRDPCVIPPSVSHQSIQKEEIHLIPIIISNIKHNQHPTIFPIFLNGIFNFTQNSSALQEADLKILMEITEFSVNIIKNTEFANFGSAIFLNIATFAIQQNLAKKDDQLKSLINKIEDDMNHFIGHFNKITSVYLINTDPKNLQFLLLHLVKALNFESQIFRNQFSNIHRCLIQILNKHTDRQLNKTACQVLGQLINLQQIGTSLQYQNQINEQLYFFGETLKFIVMLGSSHYHVVHDVLIKQKCSVKNLFSNTFLSSLSCLSSNPTIEAIKIQKKSSYNLNIYLLQKLAQSIVNNDGQALLMQNCTQVLEIVCEVLVCIIQSIFDEQHPTLNLDSIIKQLNQISVIDLDIITQIANKGNAPKLKSLTSQFNIIKSKGSLFTDYSEYWNFIVIAKTMQIRVLRNYMNLWQDDCWLFLSFIQEQIQRICQWPQMILSSNLLKEVTKLVKSLETYCSCGCYSIVLLLTEVIVNKSTQWINQQFEEYTQKIINTNHVNKTRPIKNQQWGIESFKFLASLLRCSDSLEYSHALISQISTVLNLIVKNNLTVTLAIFEKPFIFAHLKCMEQYVRFNQSSLINTNEIQFHLKSISTLPEFRPLSHKILRRISKNYCKSPSVLNYHQIEDYLDHYKEDCKKLIRNNLEKLEVKEENEEEFVKIRQADSNKNSEKEVLFQSSSENEAQVDNALYQSCKEKENGTDKDGKSVD